MTQWAQRVALFTEKSQAGNQERSKPQNRETVGDRGAVLVKADLPEIGVSLCKTQRGERISHERTGVRNCRNTHNE